MLLHTVIESKVDHIEDTAAHHRRTEAPVDTSKSQAISADDLSGHHPGGGRFGWYRRIRLHGHFDHLKGIDDDAFGEAGTKTSQRERLSTPIHRSHTS